MRTPILFRSGNRAQRERVGNHAAVPTNRSRIAPAIAAPIYLIALTGMVAGACIGGIPQHIAPSRLAERPWLDAARHRDRIAARSGPDVSHRVAPEIGMLVDEHEAVRAALAWRMPITMCH